MWCSRCQKKFCQCCLKPVTFIPVLMHIAFGQCKGKKSSKSQTFSMLLITLIFLSLFLVFKNHVSFWYSLIVSLITYYLLSMCIDWIDLLNRKQARLLTIICMFLLCILVMYTSFKVQIFWNGQKIWPIFLVR